MDSDHYFEGSIIDGAFSMTNTCHQLMVCKIDGFGSHQLCSSINDDPKTNAGGVFFTPNNRNAARIFNESPSENPLHKLK